MATKASLKTIECRRRLKHRLIQYFGGCCIRCGYDKCEGALEFHHRDPTEKCFGISRTNRSFAKQLEEAKKCDLLCVNCHAEEHYNTSG